MGFREFAEWMVVGFCGTVIFISLIVSPVIIIMAAAKYIFF